MKILVLGLMTYCLNIFACSYSPGGLNIAVVKRALNEINAMEEILVSASPKNIGAKLVILKELPEGPECIEKTYKFSISPSCKMDIMDFKSQAIDLSNCIVSK